MPSRARILWPLAVPVLGLGACSSSSSSGIGAAPIDAGHDSGAIIFADATGGGRDASPDTTATQTSDAGHDATAASRDGGPLGGGDDASLDGGDDASFDGNFGDVIVIGPPQFDSSIPDAASDAPVLDACGICDRIWVCNGFADHWVSEGSEACADIRTLSNGMKVTVATLYCENGDTINYPDAVNNAGTWSTTSTGLALDYDGLDGTMEIDCVPGS